MTTPTETPPPDPTRDAFRVVIAFLQLLTMPRSLVKLDGIPESVERAARYFVRDSYTLNPAVTGLRELVERAAEKHARHRAAEREPRGEGAHPGERAAFLAGVSAADEDREFDEHRTCADPTDDPPLTEADLRAAEGRCERATSGPWAHLIRQEKGQHPTDDDTAHVVRTAHGPITESLTGHDAAFIAAARTDLPRALREIRRLRATTDEQAHRLTAAAKHLGCEPDVIVSCAETRMAEIERLESSELDLIRKAGEIAVRREAEIERLTRELAALRAPAPCLDSHCEHPAHVSLGQTLTRGEAHRKLLALGMTGAEAAHMLDYPGEALNPMRPAGTVTATPAVRAIVAAYQRHAAPSDPLAGLPAEERDRILGMGTDAAIEAIDAGKSNAEAIAARDAVRRREVAAYHARLPVNSIGTCSRCGYYGPGPGHDCPALTPAEQAEIIAGAPGQIGPGQTPIGHPARVRCKRCRYESTTGARHEGDVCPNEGCGGILRAARPIADVLAEIDERTAGPGPLAGDGALLRRCAEEIRRLRAVVLAANNSLDIPDADDAEHQIESHGATLPALVRRWARAIRVTQDILTKHAWEILESAEPAAKSQTLPADASLEARAILAWRTWDQSPPAEPDPVDWSDVPPAGQAAWRAVVRAVDASRHTLTEIHVLARARALFINLLEIDARARRLCEDASIDHTTTPPSATVEVDQLEALDAALNAVDPSEEYDPAMRDMLLAQLDVALSRGAAPASAHPASAEVLARQAAAILSEDEHAEEDTRAGIEQLNQEIKP